MQTKITLRVHQSILDRVSDFCADEDFIPEDGDYYLVYFPFIENDYYYSILLSFGSKCECLEPLYIRKEMKRRIHELTVLYET
ncbi:WYL domain-containing protein [Enterococcus raffinosus]|uniref:WYL domain-containing protein n=1 Tax=Enterococcus raffinosus TaxID=71452 RepID=UPI0035DDDFC0